MLERRLPKFRRSPIRMQVSTLTVVWKLIWRLIPPSLARIPKEVQWADEEDTPLITHHLLMRDIQTANDLERLEKTFSPTTENEQAEAMYQLASYQYEASSLLLQPGPLERQPVLESLLPRRRRPVSRAE